MSAALQAARWAAATVMGIVAGAAIGLVIAAIALYPVGYRPFTVLSGSMEPAIATGDVVVDERIKPLDVRVGDVVTFRDPQNPARLVTHRVVDAQVRGRALAVVTKGDRNSTPEQWSVPLDGEVGRVKYRLPALGYGLAWTRKLGPVVLIALPALLLALFELVRIWRMPPKEVASEAAA